MNQFLKFEDIQPYNDVEINSAIRRITANPIFQNVINYLFPDRSNEKIISELNTLTSALEFQLTFMYPTIKSILKQTSNGLSCSGFDNIAPNKAYIFIANHRDILLDSAIVQVLLVDHGYETSEITFGNNLMTSDFIIDVCKVNRMFEVVREGSKKEMLFNSKKLSYYLRYKITEENTSIWIAQQKGRTKDGNDKTEPGLLKMLNMSGNGEFIGNFSELNIVPVTISYEYEPCDISKAIELYSCLEGTYTKKPDEDIQSLVSGITQYKGKIHVALGKPINDELQNIKDGNNNDKINEISKIIDKQIYKDYKLWKTNYIAYDLLNNDNKFINFYTLEEKEDFEKYIFNHIKNIDADKNTLKKTFLNIYANPVVNSIAD